MSGQTKHAELESVLNQQLAELDQNDTLDLLASVIKEQAARHLQASAIFVEALRKRIGDG